MTQTSEQHVPSILRQIYYNPRHPASYSSSSQLLAEARKTVPFVTRREVDDYLQTQFPYTLHRRVVRRFKRNPIVVSGPEELLQADLIDTQKYAKENDGVRYILTIIDVFTKRAYAYPLRDKKSSSVALAFNHFFENVVVPEKLQTDAGTEFTNKELQDIFTRHGVHHYLARNEVIKCAVVERFQRTLQERLHKYMTATSNNRFIDVLNDVMHAYNNRVHSSIGLAPVEVSNQNKDKVFEKLYKAKDLRELSKKSKRRHDIKVGDMVRVARKRTPFQKGYTPTFTDELYKISYVSPSRGTNQQQIELYSLVDKKGRELRGRYYRQELSLVAPSVETYSRPHPDYQTRLSGRQKHG